jgi:hypothetical protein
MKVSLEQQIWAMEDAVRNHRGYVTLVRRLVVNGERPEEILTDTEARLPLMEAALGTLKWLQENRDTVVAAYKSIKNTP